MAEPTAPKWKVRLLIQRTVESELEAAPGHDIKQATEEFKTQQLAPGEFIATCIVQPIRATKKPASAALAGEPSKFAATSAPARPRKRAAKKT